MRARSTPMKMSPAANSTLPAYRGTSITRDRMHARGSPFWMRAECRNSFGDVAPDEDDARCEQHLACVGSDLLTTSDQK